MGWEERRQGRLYYYRKERCAGRVRSRYIGAGEQAEMIAQLDALGAEERARERALELAERERIERIEAEVTDACCCIEILAGASLIASGFHTHKRQWRRKS